MHIELPPMDELRLTSVTDNTIDLCLAAHSKKLSRMRWRLSQSFSLRRLAVIVWLAAMATVDVSAAAAEQSLPAMSDVGGPGQAVARPMPACPRTISCQLAERNFLPNGYRVQSLQVCGANCTTQYWVSASTDDQELLEIDPVRGGGVLAVRAGASSDSHPPVRTAMPSYAAGDPACCPSAFADTTYVWDDASGALVASEQIVTPASDFPGWDAVRQELLAEGWTLAV